MTDYAHKFSPVDCIDEGALSGVAKVIHWQSEATDDDGNKVRQIGTESLSAADPEAFDALLPYFDEEGEPDPLAKAQRLSWMPENWQTERELSLDAALTRVAADTVNNKGTVA